MLAFFRAHYRWLLFLIPVLSLAMHAHMLHRDLIGIHVWRQTQTQTVIEHFYREDFNILNPRINDKADTDRIFRMEFPIMQWLFACFYRLFGDHIIISRLLTFLLGTCSVMGMFRLIRHLFDRTDIALAGAWAFSFSPVFYYYTVNPLPDNFALMCGIWSLALWWQYLREGHLRQLFLAALMLGLATLSKLPFIIYGTAPLLYVIMQLVQKERRNLLPVVLIFGAALLPAAAWYAWVIPGWQGNGVTSGMLDNHISWAETLDIVHHNLISTLPELLVNYGAFLFFLAGIYYGWANRNRDRLSFRLLLATVLIVCLYFVFEMNMIAKVHDYYLFPFLPFLFIVVAYGAVQLLESRRKWLRYLSVLCLAVLPLTAFLRIDSRWSTKEPGFNPAYYQYKETLRQIIPASALCISGNDDSHFITLYYLQRKGWSFDHDNLSSQALDFYISKGAAYLCTDSDIDKDPVIQSRLSAKIFEQGTLRVYQLK